MIFLLFSAWQTHTLKLNSNDLVSIMNKIGEFSLPDILVDKLESTTYCRCCQVDFADSLVKESSLCSRPFPLAWILDWQFSTAQCQGRVPVPSPGLRKFSGLPPLLRDMLLPCEQAPADPCQLKSFKQLNINQHLNMCRDQLKSAEPAYLTHREPPFSLRGSWEKCSLF